MRKRLKVMVSFIVAFTMILTMGISSISEIVEEPTPAAEQPTQEPVQEPTQEPVQEPTQEPVQEPTQEPVQEPTQEPVQEPTQEPVQEPTQEPAEIISGDDGEIVEVQEEVIGIPSINAFVSTDKDLYEFGDNLVYNIVLVNDGEVDLTDILISDDLNGKYSVDNLKAGEEKIITKQYFINPDSGLEEISNNIYISTKFNEEEVSTETSFKVGFVEYFEETIMPMMRNMIMTPKGAIVYPDTIAVNKTAARVIPGCRLYEVTLSITGTPPPAKPVDVVLVIDRSGSMGGSTTRLIDAKTAAKTFAGKVLNAGGNGNPNNNRIAVVSYAASAGTNLAWSSDLGLVESAIEGLVASGTTNIQAGFIKAETQINNAIADSTRANSSKAIVLLSDGEANERVSDPTRTYPNNHNKNTAAAYQKGEDLQLIANVFTIGLGISSGSLGEDTLKRAAQAGNYYSAPDSNQLLGIYNQISTQLNSSATNAVVVDKIGDDFELIQSSLPTGATYNSTTREITWTPGTIGTYAELKYKIIASSTFLGGPADTNKYANLNYTDVNGNTALPKPFPIPNVIVPAPLAVSLTDATITIGNSIFLGTGTDENGENYMSPISGGDGDPNAPIPYTYEWRIVGNPTVFSTVENTKVTPMVDTVYQLTVTDSNGCKAIATMTVMVVSSYLDTIAVDKTAVRYIPGCRLYEVTLKITGTPPPAKPVDVVLVIDRSGSMDNSNRMKNAKIAAKEFADNVLNAGGNGNPNNNRIAVVSYSDSATTNLVWNDDVDTVKTTIQNLNTGGYTNIQGGFINAGVEIGTARANASKAIVLLSDGEANRRVSDPTRTYPNNHNKNTAAAYQKGEDLQLIANVFTIGLGISSGSLGEDTLKRAAQAGNYYSAPDSNQLLGIYNQISTQLNSSATNAVVVDKIGDDFELIQSSLPTGATYNSTTREITWTPGTIGTYAELKYKIIASSTFLGGPADTNKYANLNYTDVNGNTALPKPFPIPNVIVPAPLAVSLTDATITIGNSIFLGTGTDENGENYMSPISGGDGDPNAPIPYTYEWRIVGNPTVFSTVENPEVTPMVNTVYQLTVTDSNGCKAIATMTVMVEDPKGSITITKVVQNPKAEDSDLEFDIFINGPNGTQYVVTLKNGESQTLNNLTLGTYTISEIVPMNYKLVGISNTSITLGLTTLTGDSIVTNKPSNGGWFHDDDTRKNTFTVGVITIPVAIIPEKVIIAGDQDKEEQ